MLKRAVIGGILLAVGFAVPCRASGDSDAETFTDSDESFLALEAEKATLMDGELTDFAAELHRSTDADRDTADFVIRFESFHVLLERAVANKKWDSADRTVPTLLPVPAPSSLGYDNLKKQIAAKKELERQKARDAQMLKTQAEQAAAAKQRAEEERVANAIRARQLEEERRANAIRQAQLAEMQNQTRIQQEALYQQNAAIQARRNELRGYWTPTARFRNPLLQDR